MIGRERIGDRQSDAVMMVRRNREDSEGLKRQSLVLR